MKNRLKNRTNKKRIIINYREKDYEQITTRRDVVLLI